MYVPQIYAGVSKNKGRLICTQNNTQGPHNRTPPIYIPKDHVDKSKDLTFCFQGPIFGGYQKSWLVGSLCLCDLLWPCYGNSHMKALGSLGKQPRGPFHACVALVDEFQPWKQLQWEEAAGPRRYPKFMAPRIPHVEII